MDPGPPRIDHGLGGGWDLFLVAALLPFLGTASVVSRTLTFRSRSVGNLGLRRQIGSCRLPGEGSLVRRPPGLEEEVRPADLSYLAATKASLMREPMASKSSTEDSGQKDNVSLMEDPTSEVKMSFLCVETSWLKNPATTLVPEVVMSVMSICILTSFFVAFSRTASSMP